MGNHISHRPSDGSGRVILSDGTIKKYDKPLTVAELMLDHPQQVVIEFQTAANGKKPIPLPADMKLESGKVYMMVPMRNLRGKPAMTSEEAHGLLLRANAVLNSKSLLSAYTGFLPLFARMCPAISVRVSGEKTVATKKDLEEKCKEMWKTGFFKEVNNYVEEIKVSDFYLSRQLSGKNGNWKPSLDTIKENGVNAKIRHWLF